MSRSSNPEIRLPGQESLFLKDEGNNWFSRNKAALNSPERVTGDWPLKMLQESALKPKKVLEIGCSNGWRLAEIRRRYNSECLGIEPSQEAIAEGKASYSQIEFRQGVAAALPLKDGETFDLVIVNFVLHWVSRQALLRSVAEADRAVADGGFLLLGDFLPDYPTKVHYHHLPKGEAKTYKLDYASIFLASALYSLVARDTFDHDHGLPIQATSASRGVCSLLRKSYEEFYLESQFKK